MTADDAREVRDEALVRAWQSPPGLVGRLIAVNHKQVGLAFILTALGFFLIAGVDSLVLRTQLIAPEAGIVPPDRFNQLFTTHGSAMMYLFAVPMVEGLGIYLVPLMIGARDMPFPRATALGYWLYLFAGLLIYSTTLPDIVNFLLPGNPLPVVVPDGGWFAYPPLTSAEYSPGPGMDFWLLGVTMAEISGILGAIELIALILLARAPGMSLNRMPIFVWSILVTAFAILFAFPSVVVGSLFLELERQLGMPFYDPEGGGNPILWQHLFWIFGHPEVYITFLPATGVVSMIIPVFARRPIVGYTLIVVAIIATATVSFGLWVHHMFAVGLPFLGLALFSAPSMFITVPSGVQVFAWLATLIAGRRPQLTTAMLFALGFIVTFVAGGLTGVMVASVPFDLQVHDTYFVVAHFHYVLVGGVVFPVFAGLFFWWPKATGRMLSERLGRWTFWLFFIGFNVAFLPQHNVGLLGMRRRIFTYDEASGFWPYNLVSTIGTYVMAAAVALFLLNVARTMLAGKPAGRNPWAGDTLEWAVPSPPPAYNFGSIPEVTDRHPLWTSPEGKGGTEARTDHVPPVAREMLLTDPLDARAVGAARLPGPSPAPLVTAVTIAAAFVAILFDLYLLVPVAFAATAVAVLLWLWPSSDDRSASTAGPTLPGEYALDHPATRSIVWWGWLLGTAALAVVFANLVLAFLFVATDPVVGTIAVLRPEPVAWLVGGGSLVAAPILLALGRRSGTRGASRGYQLALGASVALGTAAVGLLLFDAVRMGFDPTFSADAAVAAALVGFVCVVALAGVAASAIVLAQSLLGYLAGGRGMNVVDGLLLYWSFVAGSALVALLLVSVTVLPSTVR